MSSSTNQNTNARSMNGIITIDDGNGTIIENGTITTSNLEVLDNVGVNNLNVAGEVTADTFSLSFPDSSSKYIIDDTLYVGKIFQDSADNIYLSGRTIVNGTLKAPSITLGSTDLQGTLNLKAPLASPALTGTATALNLTASGTITTLNLTATGTITGIDKTDVGLGSVNNTSDADKPVSTATNTALDLKAPKTSPNFKGTPDFSQTDNVTGLVKANVGLGNVNNTSDATKFANTPLTGTTTAVNLTATGTVNLTGATVTGISKTTVGLGNVDNTSDATKFANTPLTGTTTALNIKFPVSASAYGLIWGENYSRIYDNGDLRIETDDNMWITGPAKVTIKTPSLIATGTDNLSTFIASANEKVTVVAGKGANDSNYLIVQTITVKPNHSGTITVYSPLSFFLSHEASATGQTNDNLTRTLNSASCAILKNGVAFSNPTVNSTNGYGITKSYLILKTIGATWEQFVTSLYIDFTPTYNASTTDVYQIGISASVTQSNYFNVGILRTVNFNTDVSTRTTIGSVTFNNADGANYIAPQNTTDFNNNQNLPALDGWCRTGGLISGEINASGLLTANAGVSTTTLNTTGIITAGGKINANAEIGTTNLTTSGTISSTGQVTGGSFLTAGLVQCGTLDVGTSAVIAKAQIGGGLAGFCIDSGSGSMPIFCSLTNMGANINYNDRDNYWFVMAGYRIIKYANSGYLSTSQDFDNSTGTGVAFFTSTTADTASSVRVYFKGTEITIAGLS